LHPGCAICPFFQSRENPVFLFGRFFKFRVSRSLPPTQRILDRTRVLTLGGCPISASASRMEFDIQGGPTPPLSAPQPFAFHQRNLPSPVLPCRFSDLPGWTGSVSRESFPFLPCKLLRFSNLRCLLIRIIGFSFCGYPHVIPAKFSLCKIRLCYLNGRIILSSSFPLSSSGILEVGTSFSGPASSLSPQIGVGFTASIRISQGCRFPDFPSPVE